MAAPRFFIDNTGNAGEDVTPDEATARHIVQVLRMQKGEAIEFTDGKGNVTIGTISIADKKKCAVTINEKHFFEQPKTKLHLGIALTKNASRNEWLLEKATELGVSSIILLHTSRTEKDKMRAERWHNILVSAMLQSQQCYRPALQAATPLDKVVKQQEKVPRKLVAHCMENIERSPISELLKPAQETVILIGPEGDFSAEEVNLCMQAGFKGISMGTQRLRTETAAMAACAYFNLINNG